MPNAVRPRLPWLVAAIAIWLTWYFLLGAPELRDLGEALRHSRDRSGWGDGAVLAWFGGLFAAMVLIDSLWCRWLRRRRGDLRRFHWTRLRNRRGDFICAECESIFMVAPPDLDEEAMVMCGDCGAAKARYGEMKPYLDPVGRTRSLQRALIFPEGEGDG